MPLSLDCCGKLLYAKEFGANVMNMKFNCNERVNNVNNLLMDNQI